MTDDEIQEVEDEILRLLDRLRPKDAKEHRRRDAALARVACEAVEALYEIGQPQTAEELLREKCMREINEPPCPMGVKDVAVERIRFPILVSSNERMIPLKGDIIAKMKNMNLGAATGLHLHGAKWEWNRKNRVVIDYLLRLRHLRLQKQRHYPDGWFHDENDADGLAMEETVSKLPEFGPDTWEQWGKAVLLAIYLDHQHSERARKLNEMFVHAPSKMRPAKYDNELAQIAADFEEACDSDETVDGFIGADGAQSNDVSGLLMNTNIRKPIMDAVKSLSGALAKKQAA